MDEDDQPRALWERAIGWAIVGICTFIVFSILTPGHNWSLTNLGLRRPVQEHDHQRRRHGRPRVDAVVPARSTGSARVRLAGWSPDWYAGFPVGQYYFPLPA